MTEWARYLLLIYAAVSLLAFFAYAADKRKARKRRFRTSEATLLGMGFFGGAIGALAAMNLFRHKTRKWYFWAVNFLGLIWQVTLFLYLLLWKNPLA